MDENKVTYFAQTDSRNKRVSFGIKAKDRSRHVYVIGKTGMGKSTLLENMAVQDIKNGEGMAFIDPHGKTADLLLDYIPEERIKDVVYFAPFDVDYPISFNVLESVDPDKRHLVVAGLMSTFKKIWQDAWSARMEYILTNTLLALLEYPNATLLGVNRMLSEKEFRKDVISHVTDVSVKSFWTQEFANYTERMAAEAVPAIQNKIGQFTGNALIRNLIGQPRSTVDLRKAMDERKIIIINLSKGRIGESNANLLGGMMITKLYLAAMSRADLPDRVLQTMPAFYLFVDEFQNFANESFADILSEARKYKLSLTIAHQYIEQMEEEVQAAVFGNVGTMIVFRVGATDAEYLEKEFLPQFTQEDIVNLGRFQIYLRLMIDQVGSQPFSATSLGAIKPAEVSMAPKIIETSRAQFARPREEVEKEIESWMQPTKPPVRTVPPSGDAPRAPQPQQPSDAPRPQQPQQRQSQPNPSPRPSSPTPRRDMPQERPPQQSAPQPSQSPQPRPVVQIAPQPQAPRPQPPIQREQRPPQPVQELKKPFAEAFAATPIVAPKAEETAAPVVPISLASLAPRKLPPVNKKEASPERVSDLKNALAALVKKEPVKEKTVEKIQEKLIEKSAPNVAPLAAPIPPTPAPVAQKPIENKKEEIPEATLRNLLNSDLDVDAFEDR